MLCIGKRGWPVELIKGHPIKNFFRKLLHTRSFYWGTIEEWNREREVKFDKASAVKGIKAKIDRQRNAARRGGSGCCCCDHIRDNVRDPILQAALKSTDSYVTKPACRKVADDKTKEE